MELHSSHIGFEARNVMPKMRALAGTAYADMAIVVPQSQDFYLSGSTDRIFGYLQERFALLLLYLALRWSNWESSRNLLNSKKGHNSLGAPDGQKDLQDTAVIT